MAQQDPKTAGGVQQATMDIDTLVNLLREKLGDANIQPDGLETATMKDGASVGKQKARVHFVSGLTGMGGTVTIPHKLGRVPGYIRLLQSIPAVGNKAHVAISPIEYEKWTDTTARIDVLLVGPGGLDGAIVAVEVGGIRQT